jgi:hypothetical protein
MFLVSIEKSKVCRLLFNFLFLYRIFRFLQLSVASLHCELIWDIGLSADTFVAP